MKKPRKAPGKRLHLKFCRKAFLKLSHLLFVSSLNPLITESTRVAKTGPMIAPPIRESGIRTNKLDIAIEYIIPATSGIILIEDRNPNLNQCPA